MVPMDQQNVIETFFYMLGQFAFDRAKSYVETKKEWLLKASAVNPCPFVNMLSTFAQLAEAEKLYHNHPFIIQTQTSFLPSRHFLRKERSLKDIYEDVRMELQRIEARPKQSRHQFELDRHTNHMRFPDCTGGLIVNNIPRYNSGKNTSQHNQVNTPSFVRDSQSGSLATNSDTADRSGSGSASPRPSITHTVGTDSSGDSVHLETNNTESSKPFSPFSWFSSNSNKQTKNSGTTQLNKTAKLNNSNKSNPVNVRRLLSDPNNSSNINSDVNNSGRALLKQNHLLKPPDYDATATPKVSVGSISDYTIGRLEEAQGSAQLSSRQVLSPSISSPLQQLQASNSVGPPMRSNLIGQSSVPDSTPPAPSAPASIVIADFSEELMSHFCLQLQYYTQARLELIGIYEKLYEVAGKKHIHVDGISIQLSIFCRKYQKYFHHPLLAPIKEGMTLECELLMTLIRATIDIQHWRFLSSVFDLQEAKQKLNYWAANTFNKDSSKRRFNVKAQPMPRLYDWLCKVREFLVAKFTIYFHATLYNNLPPNTVKNTCTKLSNDFHQKLSHFQKKVDALFIAMLFDVTNEKDYRGQGYHLPVSTFDQPKGKNTLQTMIVIPVDAKPKLENLQAELFMIVAGQSKALNEGQFQLFDPLKQLTFFLTKPDSHVVLIITVEGQKSDREAIIKTFMSEITNQLSGNRVVMSLNSASAKSPQR